MSGNKGILAALLASTGMTAAERAQGRFMRAPDGHPDPEFAAFEAAGDVEVGESNLASEKPAGEEGDGAEKPSKRRGPPKTKEEPKPAEKPAQAAEDDDDGNAPEEGEEQEGEEDEEQEEQPPKKRKTSSERIREQTRRIRDQERVISQLSARLDAVEKGGLPAAEKGGKHDALGEAPDPTDTEKYPLGHLDERYVEDRIEWLVAKKAADQADAVLQRQQETEQARTAQEAQTALLEKVDDLAARGAEIFEDFEETVVETAKRGDWPLEQATFEAAHEAEHGAQILHELSQDKKLAAEVAGKTPYQQLRWVMNRDAEITAKAKPNHKPGAGEPPKTQTRGANSRTQISPATDNLDDFEKAWEADARKGNR